MSLWEELTSLEMTSPSLVPTLKALLRSRDELRAIYNLTGVEAQRVVDVVNQVIDCPQLTESLRKATLQMLCKLCDSCQLLPTECVLSDELVESQIQIGSGGFADVWEGAYEGMQVAIKRLRTRERDNSTKLYKRFCKEVVIWKKLSHPNILSLLGVSTKGGNLRMISQRMNHGNIMTYLSAWPSANRLLLLANVGEGLSYLHNLDLVHGDLKGANILVDDECMPRIADFGLMSILRDTDTVLDTHTSVGGVGTPRWSAPELLDPPTFGLKSCQPSKQSDCYSFGMTIYEALVGKVPFHDSRTDAVMMRIVRGIRPERPRAIGFTDSVWTMVEKCWKEERSHRPDAPTVAGCLMTAAAQWTPTPPLDDTHLTNESETFSVVSLYVTSESIHASDSVTLHHENPGCEEDEAGDKTVMPPYYHNTFAAKLCMLAERFYGYYQKSRELEHLDFAIKHEKEAALTHFPTHPGRSRCLMRLAGYYYERYEVSQDPRDIELSIETGSDVERRTTANDQIRPDALLTLAKAYHIYNHQHFQPKDLESATRYGTEAVTLYPTGHPSRAEALVVLSVALYDRYHASLDKGDFQLPLNDLDDAISNSIVAIDIFPMGDPRLFYSHMKLSGFLFARYQQRKDLNDLRQSVHHGRLASMDPAPQKRAESLINLGQLLTYLSHDSQTLTELASCSREALDLLPPDDHRRLGAIQNLVTASHRMYLTLNSTAHLDDAIEYNRQLLRLLQYGSGHKYSQLQLHRNLLEYRWNERQLDADLAEVAEISREIAEAGSQTYYGRCYSARPSIPLPSPSNALPPRSPVARTFEYRPPRHWSPRPYHYDDSAVSAVGSDHSDTGSVETGNYGSGSESSLVGYTMNLSFIEHNSGRYRTPPHS